jgi:putative peptidoglycan lipid II flippase
MAKGAAVTDSPSGSPLGDATKKIPRQNADDFQPDLEPDAANGQPIGTSAPAQRPRTDYAGDPSREPLAFDAPREPVQDPVAAEDDIHLIPGASIAGGRYRLLVFHGGAPYLQFWQALDTALDRQVALTFVDPDGALPHSEVQEILSRTMRLSRVEANGIARVLDVADTGSGGLVVSEWIRGGSLQEVADTAPSPIGGARAIQSLAAAAEAAHQSGVALSVDHPGRVRVSVEGDVVLAFPATLPDATPEDDIRGIGAALYALLINRWPLAESGTPSGFQAAARDASGQPVEARAVDRAIPFQISAAASRAVQENGGIRTAPTLLNLLQQATALADRTDLMEPVDRDVDREGVRPLQPADHETLAQRRRALIIGGCIAGAIILVALVVLASVLSKMFGDVGGGLNGDQLGLNPPTSATSGGATTGAATGGIVKPVRATVFSPQGEADAPSLAGLAIDGNPATMWPSDTYSDPAPFPGFKNGVGLMLQLPSPTTLGTVGINVTSTGTQVQIRASATPNPSSLDDTTVLTPPTPLQRGNNTIQVNASGPTSNVLVWISTLGTVDGKSRTDISEITLRAAG